MRLTVWCAPLLCLLLACGSDSKSAAPVVARFTATPDALPHGGGEVTLSWEVADAASVSIEPGIGPVEGDSRVVQVSADTTFRLTATGPGGTDTAEVTVALAQTIVVEGQVFEAGIDVPMAGAEVLLGKEQTTTDAEGRFRFENVRPPYWVAVRVAAGARVHLVDGLRAARPAISIPPGETLTPLATSTISGTITGASSGFQRQITFDAAELRWGSSSTSGTAFQFSTGWPTGVPSITGELHVLENKYGPSSSFPTFGGHGVLKNVTAYAGGGTPGLSVPLQPVSTGVVAGSWATPPGFIFTDGRLGLRFPHGGEMQLPLGDGGGSDFLAAVPVIPGVTASLSFTFEGLSGGFAGVNRTGLAPGTSGIKIEVPAAPVLKRPVDGEVVSGTPVLSWDGDFGVYELELTWVKGARVLQVTTSAKEFAVPVELAAFDRAFAPEQTVEWLLLGRHGTPTVDAAVDPARIGQASGHSSWASAAFRSFTTSP